MVGVKGHSGSGGYRKGAGRKPRSIRVRHGTKVFVNELFDNQPALGESFSVEILTRDHIALKSNRRTIHIIV